MENQSSSEWIFYQPLDPEKGEIRLSRLNKPLDEEDEKQIIKFSIETTSLDDPPKYSALSYESERDVDQSHAVLLMRGKFIQREIYLLRSPFCRNRSLGTPAECGSTLYALISMMLGNVNTKWRKCTTYMPKLTSYLHG